MQYSVVIACFHSERFLQKTVEELMKAFSDAGMTSFEIILVDDGSKDQTYEQIKQLVLRYPSYITGIELMKNAGQHNAILAGLRASTGDVVINMDDDLQHRPSYIADLLNKLDEGYDVVYAIPSNAVGSLSKRMASKIHIRASRWLQDRKEDWEASSFWVARRPVIDEIIKYTSDMVNIQSLFARTTDRIANVAVEFFPREQGVSGYSLKKSLRLWSAILNYTERPAVLMMKSGVIWVLLVLTVFLFALLLTGSHILFQALVLSLLLSLIGIIVATAGLVILYINRVFRVLHHSPQYVITEICKKAE